MPDVARDPGEIDRGVAALEAARHRHFGNGMPLPVVFAQEERVDPSGVAAHNYILVVVGKNLRLNEVARAESSATARVSRTAQRARLRKSSSYSRGTCAEVPCR